MKHEFAEGDMVGNFRLHEHRGNGAFGDVFRATHVLLDRECALKLIKVAKPEEFKEHLEGQILERCKHENTVEVYDVSVHAKDGELFAGISMEYMSKGSALDAVEKGEITLRQAIRMTIDVLFAIEHAHANDILHRDIKPANIMVADGSAKLTDFGVAASIDITKMGSANGTPVFCAPEVFEKRYTDVRTEIYSVGMSLFQLCTQVVDWDGLIGDIDIIHAGKTIHKIGYGDFVPSKIRRICNRACNLDPSKRYQSALEMRQALERLSIAHDWRRTGVSSWEAQVVGKTHTQAIEQRKHTYHNVYRAGGRRQTRLCSTHDSFEKAISRQQKIVAETALK